MAGVMKTKKTSGRRVLRRSNPGGARPLHVYPVSLGCPKNRVDTEYLLAALAGLEGPDGRVVDIRPEEDPARADLVLVNTCGFIRPAVEESVDTILELARDLAEAGSTAPLAVAGCLVGRYGASELAAGLPEVAVWLGPDEMDRWPGLAAKALGLRPVPAVPAGDSRRPAWGRCLSTGPGFAYLKISEGCSHACAFCTIPSIRGPHRSRPAGELAAEAQTLLDQGVGELVLVGQDVTAWGGDLPGRPDLRVLLEALLPLPGLRRLRLMYLYPAGLTEELLGFLAGAGAPFVPYFDVPLQHAHPIVLGSMGRPFARDPRRVVERVRRYFPDAALRTTLITGYPGEGQAEFQALRDFVEEMRFHHLGVFAYQAEEGTRAAALPDQVPEAVREARRDEIMALQSGISAAILDGYVGQRLEVLVEAEQPDWPGLFTGRTWFQAPEVDGITYVSAPPQRGLSSGEYVEAEIDEAREYDLVALVDPDSEGA